MKRVISLLLCGLMIFSLTACGGNSATAYGARGTYHMSGTHWFELRNGNWISVNAPNS